MSTFTVPVTTVDEILPHTNADSLEIAHITGSLFQVVVPKGQYNPGDRALYVPVDAVVPQELSDQWGVTKYLSNGRVRAARLRGEVSYGFLADPGAWVVGSNLAEGLGITHYEPPIKVTTGDCAPQVGGFLQYTDIESLMAYPGILEPGERVIVTEKLHGTNSRIAHIPVDGEPTIIIGSRTNRRKLEAGSLYESPLSVPGVRELVTSFDNCILFGEICGSKIQGAPFAYGSKELVFKAFDLMVDGKYHSHDCFLRHCEEFKIPTVPVLFDGPFDTQQVRDLSNGRSTLSGETVREGIVVRPEQERTDPKIGRIILKLHGDDFLLSKHS
jgi:RNA ligase (TIGR02306 family)